MSVMTGQIINYDVLNDAPRLLMEVELKPRQGHRFQPTGFPHLGPARYTLPDGSEMLLVESPQSVANRMELACWDASRADLMDGLGGLPYIQVYKKGETQLLTTSILEAHRVNSEYIAREETRRVDSAGKLADRPFRDELKEQMRLSKNKPVDFHQVYATLLRYDPNSLIHGCFLEEIDSRLRVTRLLSGFIEAREVLPVESSGVKISIVSPAQSGGEGNVLFHRTEFVAKEVKAFFNLDLALLRGYGLHESAQKLLIALSLFKVRRFLSTGLRLRTACDLEQKGEVVVTHPAGFTLPSESDLLSECQRLIKECHAAGLFAEPPVTKLYWDEAEAKKRKNQQRSKETEETEDEGPLDE